MIFYKCDHCGVEKPGKAPITLKGYLRKFDGRILLPDQFHEKHFCERLCFRLWMYEDIKHAKSQSNTNG
jgi:hypothetical protein